MSLRTRNQCLVLAATCEFRVLAMRDKYNRAVMRDIADQWRDLAEDSNTTVLLTARRHNGDDGGSGVALPFKSPPRSD